MIAEIYHKSVSRSEDELTGNFFGTMRYIPYQNGLNLIFRKYAKSKDKEFVRILEEIKSDEFEFFFWKKLSGKGEIDGYISVENKGIGIEVKYQSNLSGDNQLEREAYMIKEWCNAGDKLLLFVADERVAKEVYLDNYEKQCFKEVHLGYISWQDILKGLDDVVITSRYEELMVEDLKKLLKEKGFVAFNGFKDLGICIDGGKYYEFG